MRLPRGVRRLFRLARSRRDPEAELDEELEFHFRATVEELTARGMEEEAAWREARRRFGDEEAYRRALRRIDGWTTTKRRGGEMMDALRQHLVFALRGVRRSPGFTAAVVAILALGMGANAVMFGMVDRLLLSPPQHVEASDEVRHLWLERSWSNGTRPLSRIVTFADYEAMQGVEAFGAVAAYTHPRSVTLGRGTGSEMLRAVQASASLFPLLGVQPAVGRFYGPDEDALGAPAAAVLSHEFWTRRFGADPGVVGRALELGGGTYRVVGVAPAGFTGAELRAVDVWLPLVRSQELETEGTLWMDGHGWWWLRMVARLAPDVGEEAASAEATAAHRGGRADLIEAGDYDRTAEIRLGSLVAGRGPEPAAEVRVAKWLAGVSLVVLFIACFNVANLLLARAARWRRELAVRTALGISRARLLTQLLTESLLLAALGSAGAWLVVVVGSEPLHHALLPDVAFTDTGARARLLAFLAVATVLTALLAGLLPALQASRTQVSEALRSGGRGGSPEGSRVRTGLLVGQAALSAALLVGAGLFVLSLERAQGLDLGLDAERVAVLVPIWSEGVEPEEREPELVRLAERLERVPGVERAARVQALPFMQHLAMGGVRVPGLDSLPRHPAGGPYVNRVSSGYFEVMGLSMVRGRAFTEADDAPGAAPVMAVTEAMAEAFWPGRSALGECVLFQEEGEPEPPCTTVVGVVEDHRRQELVEARPHFLYFLNLPHPMVAEEASSGVVLRTAGPAAAALPALGTEARAASGALRHPRLLSLQEQLEPQLRAWRLGATMFTVFGLLALVVAALGLYSVLAYDVALRRHELGVRAALGADVSRLVGMVFGRALRLVAAGTAVGLAVAVAASPWIEPLLFRVSPRSPWVYLAVAGTLMAAAALAGSVPAWRTTRIDPRRALEAE